MPDYGGMGIVIHLIAALAMGTAQPHFAVSSSAPVVLKMVRDINAERQTAGRPPLGVDEKLSRVAEQRAKDMVKEKYFSHIQPDGRTPFDIMAEEGCSFGYAGENIALAEDEPEAIGALWSSPEHRGNTLGTKYRKIGLAVATLTDGSKVFVEDFSD